MLAHCARLFISLREGTRSITEFVVFSNNNKNYPRFLDLRAFTGAILALLRQDNTTHARKANTDTNLFLSIKLTRLKKN